MTEPHSQSESATMPWRRFRQQLHAAYNGAELVALCFDVGVSHDGLGAADAGKQVRVTKLIETLHEQGRIADLLAALREERPHLKWPVQLPERSQAASPFGVPHRFQSFIDEWTQDFVGRDYVFAAIMGFLEGRPNGFIEIEGDPGAGKSAIMAEYVQRFNIIAHFNRRGPGTNTVRHFMESICSQLINRFNLPYPALPPEATEGGSFLAKLLEEAALRLPAGQRLVIGVDALDEVDMSGHRRGANILYLPGSLPDRVHFILTRRKMSLSLDTFAHRDFIDLMAYRSESEADIRHYLRQALEERPALRQWIASRPAPLTEDVFVDTLTEKSENNFMYLRHVLPDIGLGRYQDLTISQLPLGLKGYYIRHWKWMGMEADPRPDAKLKIIYTICEGLRPMSRKMICDFTGESASTVQTVLDEWREFLHGEPSQPGERYTVYHTSFRDFLLRQGTVNAAGVDLKQVHSRIAGDLLAELRGDG